MRMAWCVTVLLVLATLAAADTKKKDNPGTKLKPVPWSKLPNGKIITLEGTTGKEEQRFALESLDVLQPVTVALVAVDPSAPVEVQLAKDRWDEKLRDEQTGSDGKAIVRLRTEGELRVVIRAPEPRQYRLMVWVGDEVKPKLQSVIVPMKAYEEKHPEARRGGSTVVFKVIAGALIAIVLLLFVLVVKKKGRK